MKVGVVAFSAFLFVAASLPASADTHSATAPADEYFGPQKISVLGVRTMLDRATTRLDYGVGNDDATVHSVELAETTMHAWQTRYPNDYWLPRMYAKLQTIYARMSSPQTKLRAADIASLLIVSFPSSNEARAMRAVVAQALAAPQAPQAPSAPTAVVPTASIAAAVTP